MQLDDIYRRLKISSLTPMQEAAAHEILHTQHDVVILSPTGSGKTLAYLLPLIQRINPEDLRLQAVVIVPGRELAQQSAAVLNEMKCGIKAMAVTGGRPAMEEHRLMKALQPQLLFATPGRLNDHLEKGNANPERVQWLVIDEFDKCLNMGFQAEMEKALDLLVNVRRRILLSATEAEAIPRFVNMSHVARLDFLDETTDAEGRISTFIVNSPEKDKLHTLSQLLRSRGGESSIVFLNYRDSVERTADFLREEGFAVAVFHGGLDQKQREAQLYRFSNASANVLVATDLAARGLDIPEIDNIIHYHLPLGKDEMVHRVGRTARWEASGKTFFILGPEEQLPDYVDLKIQSIQLPEQYLPVPSPKMATIYIGKGKKDKISKADVVGFLCKNADIRSAEIGRIDIAERYAYVAVVAGKLSQVLKGTQNAKIKGQRTVVELIK